MELRRPTSCPNCGSTKLVPILYGRPSPEGEEALDRGEMTWGGCFIMPGRPDWQCTSCGHDWFDPADPVRIRREKLLDDLTNRFPDDEEQERK